MTDNPVGNGRVFTADLVDLYRTGLETFPDLSAIYAELSIGMDAQRGPLQSGTATFLPAGRRVLGVLSALHTELQHALAQSSTNLADTGRVLVEVAQSYATLDDDVAADFASRVDELDPQAPQAPPPPAYPTTQRQGQGDDQ